MITPSDFLELTDKQKNDNIIRFGKIASNYTSGRPKIIFDGASAASVKSYPYLASYTPAANDRVMIIKNVVIGKII